MRRVLATGGSLAESAGDPVGGDKILDVSLAEGNWFLAPFVLNHCARFGYFTVDVDADPVITQQYAALVPVVVLGGRHICHYFLDQAALLQALADENPA